LSANAENKNRLRRYLLGLIPWEEASDIEQKLLGDAEFYEELQVTEDELIDLYLAERLPPLDKQKFESHFLATAERQQKTRFGKLFADYLATRQEAKVMAATAAATSGTKAKRPWWLDFSPFRRHPVIAFVATLAVCISLVSLLWFGFKPDRNRLRTETLAVTLVPGAVREGGSTQRIQVSPTTLSVAFTLQIERDTYQGYQAEVLSENVRVWQQDHLRSGNESGGQQSVFLVIPADHLKPGDYQIKLSGVSNTGELELVARYGFRVIPQ